MEARQGHTGGDRPQENAVHLAASHSQACVLTRGN